MNFLSSSSYASHRDNISFFLKILHNDYTPGSPKSQDLVFFRLTIYTDVAHWFYIVHMDIYHKLHKK